MSNFSSLKTAIANAIKQNGNQEITGNLLQGILLSIVETLGDSAINTLETGLSNEANTRGNADTTLQTNINNEATARGNADTQLNNLITGIKNNIDNGYVYAGIAIPTTSPVSGKVFYIATKAGTYTNLGGLSVTEGITILKYNGSTWSKEQVIYGDGGVFDVTAQNGGATFASLEALLGSNNLSTLIPTAVRKGGMSIKFVQSSDNKYVQARCMANEFTTDTTQWAIAEEGVYVENPEFVRVVTDNEDRILYAVKADGDFYFGAGVPQQIIDYVIEHTNATKEELLTLIDTKVDKEEGKSLIDAEYASSIQFIENPEFTAVWLDNEEHILFGIQTDCNFYFGCGVPRQVKEYIEQKIEELSLDEYESIVAFIGDYLNNTTLEELLSKKVDGEYVENPEFIEAKVDAEDKVLEGIQKDGTKVIGGDLRVLGNMEVSGVSYKVVENPEYLAAWIDAEDKIISYRKDDGTLVENIGIETPNVTAENISAKEVSIEGGEATLEKATLSSLELTNEGMTEFQQALKDSGFKPGGAGNFSDSMTVELPEPVHYALLNLIVDSLPLEDEDISEGYAEYYDKAGNYWKKPIELAAQGQTSRIFARTGGKGNYTMDIVDDSEIKFGSWVPQDSFHLKGCAKDVVRGILPTSYKWAYMFMEYLDAKPNRVLLKDDSETTTTHASGDRFTDWPTDARCLPDGFPVEVYINGEYWGLYSWQLKKHRKNYSMDKKDYSSCFIDADAIMTDDYTHGIWNDGPDDRTYRASSWWTGFDIKGPKDLICMDGSKFDGDHPKELIDNTSEYYDASNKAHKGSAQTKAIIRAFQTKYLEVKTLIDNEDIAGAKAKFNDNFDYNACMLVYIFNCLMRNADSVKKNTLWGTYKDGKVFPALWDLDGMYGQGWIGNTAASPTTSTWNTYANAAWPLGLFWTLYESEIKAVYAELRRNNIISINTWKPIVFGWVNRIGTEAYDRDIEKWPETPSYRKNLTNTDYWAEIGTTTNVSDYSIWNKNDTYTVGSRVILRSYPGYNTCIIYSAKVENTGVCPVTDFYEKFPQIGGFFDSPKRWEKWMVRQIELCDNFMGYTE